MRTDLLLDTNGDLPIDVTGLMPVGASDYQHQHDMFASFPGEWKQFPFNGIGISQYLKSNSNTLLIIKNKAKQQLEADGYTVGSLKMSFDDTGTLLIDTTSIIAP